MEAPNEIWLWLAKWFLRRRRLNMLTYIHTFGRHRPTYPISSPLSLWFRWAKNIHKLHFLRWNQYGLHQQSFVNKKPHVQLVISSLVWTRKPGQWRPLWVSLCIIGYSYIINFGEMNENAFKMNIQILNDRRRTSLPYFSSKDRTVLRLLISTLFRSNFNRKWRPKILYFCDSKY